MQWKDRGLWILEPRRTHSALLQTSTEGPRTLDSGASQPLLVLQRPRKLAVSWPLEALGVPACPRGTVRTVATEGAVPSVRAAYTFWRWVLALILALISQLCRPRRCNAPGQATRNPLRAAVSTTPIHSSSTTAPEARAAVRTR